MTGDPLEDAASWVQSSPSGLSVRADASVGGVYHTWLGGKDSFGEDRAVAEDIDEMSRGARAAARASRAYLEQSVTRLAALGIDQFLDLGCGIALMEGNVHQLAQAVTRQARVVYVDIDPVAVAMARAALQQPGGPGVAVLEADIRRPERILDWVRDRDVLDLERPVGVLLASVLHFVPDDEGPGEIVRVLREGLVAGSCILISHVVADDDELGALTRSAAEIYAKRVDNPPTVRTTPEITAFFDGLDPLEPPSQQRWEGRRVPVLAGIGRVPPA
jgi:SAM-dependent methyltransferase